MAAGVQPLRVRAVLLAVGITLAIAEWLVGAVGSVRVDPPATMLFITDEWVASRTAEAQLGTPKLLSVYTDPTSFVGWGELLFWLPGHRASDEPAMRRPPLSNHTTEIVACCSAKQSFQLPSRSTSTNHDDCNCTINIGLIRRLPPAITLFRIPVCSQDYG